MGSDFLAEYVHGRHTTDDYFERFVQDRPFKWAVAGFPPELIGRCNAALRSTFARLDAVPRTDPLWARSNNRVTFTKVREHPELNPTDSGDLERCWGSFVVALCSGNLERFGMASEVLVLAGQLEVSDLLLASFNLREVSGWETDEPTADILVRRDLVAVARTLLEDMMKRDSGARSVWARKVLARLGGPVPLR